MQKRSVAPIEHVAVSRPLDVDVRVALQDARQTIQGSVVRAIVELVTNSDDSYKRLAKRGGRPVSGLIQIDITTRSRKDRRISVYDQAEGMHTDEMGKHVGTFGVAPDGEPTRAYFGRGLKQAIIGLGKGEVTSRKDNIRHRCSLEIRKRQPWYEEYEPQRNKGCNETKVEIALNPDIVLPQFVPLRKTLTRRFNLRDILSSKRRSVELRRLDGKGKVQDRVDLQYRAPLAEEVFVQGKELSLGQFGNAKLEIYKAKAPLEQEGDDREGGLLICGERAIHDLTLFRFDKDPYAAKLFGRVTCSELDDLIQREDKPIISAKRDELEHMHEFYKVLKAAVEPELQWSVDKIKKDEEAKRKDIENKETRKRFEAAVKKLNELARLELPPTGNKVGPPSEPKNGFQFIPGYAKAVAGSRTTLSLKAVVPYTLLDGTKVTIRSDNEEDVSVETPELLVNEKDAVGSIVTLNPKIVGKRVGAEVLIQATATTRAGDRISDEAVVEVVSKKPPPPDDNGKKTKRGGIFSEIKFDPALPEKIRARYDRETGIISISTKAPSVAMYLGPNGEGQDKRESQVLVAELVVDAFSKEVAEQRIEQGRVVVVGRPEQAATSEKDRLVFEYARAIHQVLVPQ